MSKNFWDVKGKTPSQILEIALAEATREFDKDEGKDFLKTLPGRAGKWISILGQNSEKQKGVVTALATSLTKKIETPTQDVRYHKVELRGGYSGRTLDTKYVTPFFKKHFLRVAMKESGWLTRSIEQAHPFTLDPLFPGRIRDSATKDAFLQILNDIEVNSVDPNSYLVALLIVLIRRKNQVQAFIKTVKVTQTQEESRINQIVDSVETHFFSEYKSPGASKLPVIAIYSIYSILVLQFERYRNMKLKKLKSHVAPDSRAGEIGDVEIVDGKDRYFEALEIKHNIPITSEIIEDAYRKFKKSNVKRYYILTTAEQCIAREEKEDVNDKIKKIGKEHGCEVIVNGVIPSLKYYLRLINRSGMFLSAYTHFLIKDVATGAEIKLEHLRKWSELLAAIKKPSVKTKNLGTFG